MGRADDYWPKDDLLAAALLQIEFDWPDGTRGPIMDHETAKQFTREQIISLFHKDHYPKRKEHGGPNVFWNCTWRPISEHRAKTATVDIPQGRKGDRLSEAQEEHRRRMLAKAGQSTEEDEKPARAKRRYRWGTRKMAKRVDPWGKARRSKKQKEEADVEV